MRGTIQQTARGNQICAVDERGNGVRPHHRLRRVVGPLKSTNLADATREAEAICRDRDHDCRSQDGDGPVHDVVEAAVIAIQSVHVLDLPAFFAALDGERKIEEQRRREHAERKEYERLKQKFG